MFQFIQRLFRPQHFHDIIECLAAALEAKDLYTSGHSSRVGDMSYDLGRSMGLKGQELENLHIAAHLHDIGKMGISENILNKKGRLLPHEWAQIQNHPEIGYKILAKSKGLKQIAEIVLHHHERWDGKGYPSGLYENRIPLGSRIIGVADAVDAITSIRPYRKALSWEECWDEVVLNKGIQFDPVAVEASERLWKKWRERSMESERNEGDSKLAVVALHSKC
ncbi:phosphohydrolase [Desulfosporosinus sp. HMP52]|uniref:HD-GYP domain-containing protein n=1 Tax=Desulfosporosinus sp. HMP52 TaxID=1487923 RepID=UPI00051FE611|nr:HD-GYP domain-containing protein [Desulfosporosinus sp. HMP52]KGK91946.1 phosphohydrolase [Desulfosporosinus sp. HMP52]